MKFKRGYKHKFVLSILWIKFLSFVRVDCFSVLFFSNLFIFIFCACCCACFLISVLLGLENMYFCIKWYIYDGDTKVEVSSFLTPMCFWPILPIKRADKLLKLIFSSFVPTDPCLLAFPREKNEESKLRLGNWGQKPVDVPKVTLNFDCFLPFYFSKVDLFQACNFRAMSTTNGFIVVVTFKINIFSFVR